MSNSVGVVCRAVGKNCSAGLLSSKDLKSVTMKFLVAVVAITFFYACAVFLITKYAVLPTFRANALFVKVQVKSNAGIFCFVALGACIVE